ncbi:MAG: hypothetical protein HQL90_16220, partial [Magnetococcales bacterium]|nr:hypothetical protein [Magnetococcales bacterium]
RLHLQGHSSQRHGGQQPEEAFSGIIEKPMTMAAWMADKIISKHGDVSNVINRDRVIDDALRYDEGILDGVEGNDFWERICAVTDIELEFLKDKRKSLADKKKAKQVRNEYEELAQEIHRLNAEGETWKIESAVKKHMDYIRSIQCGDNIKPIVYDEYLSKLRLKPDGLKTEWPSLDDLIRIPNEALTIIGGRPSHGKTTVMLNMLMNMVQAEENNGKAFFFFSYEETQTQLISKVINVLSETIIHTATPGRNLTYSEDYIKQDNTGILKITEAIAKFKRYAEHEKTLWIIDEPFEIGALINTLSHIKERYDVGAVFIDYIQKIKSDGKFGTRQLELQDISVRLLDCAKSLSLPIILGAQLGRDPNAGKGKPEKIAKRVVRLDNLREAGDIEQDANLVLGVWNEAMEEAQDTGTTLRDNDVDIDIMVLKNRNGAVNEKATLTFHSPTLKISEV